MRLRFFNVGIPLLNHPDHMECVLVTGKHNFIKHRTKRLRPRFLGEGLLTSEGNFWRRQRRLAQSAFHKEGTLAGCRGRETCEITDEMMRLLLEIVEAGALFGTSLIGPRRRSFNG